jgi:hypothetical protein
VYGTFRTGSNVKFQYLSDREHPTLKHSPLIGTTNLFTKATLTIHITYNKQTNVKTHVGHYLLDT